ncbi:3405_t:CDS:2, partial [Dentiscutata erythropus]
LTSINNANKQELLQLEKTPEISYEVPALSTKKNEFRKPISCPGGCEQTCYEVLRGCTLACLASIFPPVCQAACLAAYGTYQGNLENITISSPKKISEGNLMGLYECEVYLPIPVIERKQHLIYSVNPAETLCLASEFVKSQLQFLINRGYTISEAESHKP